MAISYTWGLGIVYFGFLLCLVECIYEPALLCRAYQLQIGGLVIIFSLAAAFTIGVVLVSAPLTIDSYAIRTEEQPSKNTIAKIPWNSHFTDLRVSVTNPSDDDYHDVDLVVQPDRWNYKAAILDENSGCLVSSVGGNAVLVVPSSKGGATRVTAHYVGENFQAEDDAGDVFEPFITEGGGRLRCAKLPAHFTVQLVFALASIDRNLASKASAPLNKPGEWSFSVTELLPIDMFNLLEERPSTSEVMIRGKYARGMKRFSIARTVRVTNGN